MSKRILLVDDDQPFRESVREILESEGFEVTEYSDAVYALPHIREPGRSHLAWDNKIIPNIWHSTV